MAQRLGELAEALELPLEGDADTEVSGLASLEDAGPGDLSFVTGPRYEQAFRRSKASAFLAPPDFETGGRPVLRSRAPYIDFARVVALLYPRAAPPPGVHATAVVAGDAELGADVYIGPLAVVGAAAHIGDRTRIYPHVTIYPGVVVGADCEIHSGAHLREGVRLGQRVVVQSGAVLGSEGFGFATGPDGRRRRIPHRMGVQIGDDAEIGANSAIDASHPAQGQYGRGRTTTWIGDGVVIDNLVQVGHGVSVGSGSTLCALVGLAGSTEIGRNVTFAGKAGTTGHLRVGDGAVIGGRSTAVSDVEPGQQLLGHPGIDRRLFARVASSWKRLPDLLRRVRKIEQRLGIERR